jgi:TAP-like protein
MCAFWPVRADNRVPLPANRPPAMLFAAATRDSVVPPRNTLATMAAFRGSRLVTVDAQYHAPVPFQGNPCLLTTVAGYLTTGRLPAQNVDCPTGGL